MTLKKSSYLFLFLILVFISCEDEQPEIEDYIATPFTLNIPDDYAVMPIPEDNPMTQEGVDLGHRLFFDKRLSADNTMSCASCHLTSKGFTDGKRFSVGIDGIAGPRSSMSLIDIGYTQELFWDGRVNSLEVQALLPIEDPIEMHNTWTNALDMIRNDEAYPEMFRKAFNIKDKNNITKEDAAKAIAQYERAIVSSGNSKFDRVMRNQDLFTPEEFLGWSAFTDDDPFVPDAECSHCHAIPLFGADEFSNNGIQEAATLEDFSDNGRGSVTGVPFDNGKFRAPSLRNIELTAPYMHDGRFETLEEVIDHYFSGGKPSPNKDPLISAIATNGLQEEHKIAIIAFLKTLTDPDLQENPLYQDPF